MLAISSLPWQVITALIMLVSLLVFLPLMWVRASLPMQGASLLLTLLSPVFLVGGALLWYGLYWEIYSDHYRLQNELGGFLVIFVPAPCCRSWERWSTASLAGAHSRKDGLARRVAARCC